MANIAAAACGQTKAILEPRECMHPAVDMEIISKSFIFFGISGAEAVIVFAAGLRKTLERALLVGNLQQQERVHATNELRIVLMENFSPFVLASPIPTRSAQALWREQCTNAMLHGATKQSCRGSRLWGGRNGKHRCLTVAHDDDHEGPVR
eukprot:scaffold4855_cov195-Amphora_coffeaeformis.AAC.19